MLCNLKPWHRHSREEEIPFKTSLVAALQRLEEEEFGYCVDCGDAIEEARLSASPVILKCMSCLRG